MSETAWKKLYVNHNHKLNEHILIIIYLQRNLYLSPHPYVHTHICLCRVRELYVHVCICVWLKSRKKSIRMDKSTSLLGNGAHCFITQHFPWGIIADCQGTSITIHIYAWFFPSCWLLGRYLVANHSYIILEWNCMKTQGPLMQSNWESISHTL